MAQGPSLLDERKALREIHREAKEVISELNDQEVALREQIRDLEKFIIRTPLRLRQAKEQRLEQSMTLPAPDDWMDGEDTWADNSAYIRHVAELEPPARLMRRRVAEIKRDRRRHFLIFLTVATCVAGFGVWLWTTLR